MLLDFLPQSILSEASAANAEEYMVMWFCLTEKQKKLIFSPMILAWAVFGSNNKKYDFCGIYVWFVSKTIKGRVVGTWKNLYGSNDL